MEIELPERMTAVLAVLRQHNVQALLMGGQACVAYGASEFSRDIDIAIYTGDGNLERLGDALSALQAEVIAVPPFSRDVLDRGHAVHFRCNAAGKVRLDVMSQMRNVPSFDVCWSRRSIMRVRDAGEVDVMGIEDLVAAKKTRRDKDWPVVTKLVDVHYRDFGDQPTDRRVAFWLRELRSPPPLVDLVKRAPSEAQAMAATRTPVARAIEVAQGVGTHVAIRLALREEEELERAVDEEYWAPLIKELQEMRRERPRGRGIP
jgi:hypothetical protein